MKGSVPAAIARRYLFTRPTHGAVAAISAVSVAGVAIATAAIICVLSVFNGFHDLLEKRLDGLTSDVMIAPAKGKVFADGDSLAAVVGKIPGVAKVSQTLCDNALAICGTHEMPVKLRGVSADDYRAVIPVDTLMSDKSRWLLKRKAGEGKEKWVYDAELEDYFPAENNDEYLAAISIGASQRLGATELDGGSGILLFAPKRVGRINMANPVNSFLRDSVTVSGVFRTNQSDFDENLVITDIDLARTIFQYTKEISTLEVKAVPGTDLAALAARISAALGSSAMVTDRARQQEVNFRMVEIEKWITFLLLSFILIVASFNLISALSMIILEKRESIVTLRALGLTRRAVGRIFALESFWITLIGGALGLILGLILCYMQQRFGLIRLNGDPSTLVVSVYPVVVKASDILIVAVPLILTGLVSSAIAAAFARSRSTLIRQNS